MARIGSHTHTHTAPRWARQSVRAARTLEKTAERHWPMASYAMLTVATMAYVVVQLTRIVV